MILGATPIILTTLILSNPPVTIHTTHQEAHPIMATGITPDRGVGGGTNRQNRGNPNPLRTDLITNPVTRRSGYPTSRHPIATMPTPITTTHPNTTRQ